MQVYTRTVDTAPLSRVGRLAVAGAALLGGVIASPVRLGVTNGTSMDPMLHPGSLFVYRKLEPARARIRRGDVVLARVKGEVIVKRVMAVGGDHFWAIGHAKEGLRFNHLIDVNAPIAPWQARYHAFQSRRIEIPRNHLFLVGDNVGSEDSRTFGPVPVSAVLGRVTYPPSDAEAALAKVAWSQTPPRPRVWNRS